VALAAFIGVQLTACVSASIAPKEGALQSVRTISLVPVESPPLLLHANSKEDRAAIAEALGTTSRGAASGSSAAGASDASVAEAGSAPASGLAGLGAVYPAAGAVGGMLMLSEAASAGTKTPGEAGTVVMADPDKTWEPSVEFAGAAVVLLKDRGTFEAQVIDGYAKLPIADRSVTWHMENWLGPLRRWYGSDSSYVDYASLGSRPDLMLEIGVLNYEYFANRLLLQVWVRLIKPATGEVLGRARSAGRSEPQSLPSLLQNDAAGMKRLVTELGNPLVANCLAEVGLGSKQK
jgi:hypothetical protein